MTIKAIIENGSERWITEQIDRLIEAAEKFSPKFNKKIRSKWDKVIQELQRKYEQEIHYQIKEAERKILTLAMPGSELDELLVSLRDNVAEIRKAYFPVCYQIGKGDADQQNQKFKMQESWNNKQMDLWIGFKQKRIQGDDGKTRIIRVPYAKIKNLPVLTPLDLKRIDEMVMGTEFSVGNARYNPRTLRGSFLMNNINLLRKKIIDNLGKQNKESLRESFFNWKEAVELAFRGFMVKAHFWSNELHTVKEKAKINVFRDLFEGEKVFGVYRWIGGIDKDTCGYCADAVNGNPYYDPRVMPEPGEGDCQCNCRHAVQRIK